MSTNVKAIVLGAEPTSAGILVNVGIFNDDNIDNHIATFQCFLQLDVDLVPGVTTKTIFDLIKSRTLAFATTQDYILSASNVFWTGVIVEDFQELVDSKITTWINGVEKSNCKEYHTRATVSGGTATFYLTDNGLSSGNAIFTNIYKDSAKFWVDNKTDQHQFGDYAVAGNLKSISVSVNRLGSVLLSIIQFISGSDGTVVYLSIKGD